MIDATTLRAGSGTMTSEPWLRRHALDVLVIALAVVQQAEVWMAPVPGPRLAVMLATALWTLPLLLRHRLPFAAPAFAFAVQIGASFIDSNAFGGEVTGLIALLVTFWVVGSQDHARLVLAGAASGCATLAVIAQRDARLDTGGAIFVMVMGAAVTLLAFTLRRRGTRAAQLEQRADQLLGELERHARAAVAAERTRIASDLHDVIADGLNIMTLRARAARLLLDTQPGRAREPIVAVEETGRQTLAELRRLLGLLHQPPGEATRLPQPGMADLDALVERARSAGLPVLLTVQGTRPALPTGIDLAAYRIVQEVLTDALERAKPASAQVTVHYAPDALQVEISDDGRAVRDGDSDSDLLAALRERTGLYGGQLEAGRGADGDYAVRARLPLESRT
jgi:signal transduction histidine kinase